MQYVIFIDFAFFFLNFVCFYRLFPIQCCIFMQKFLLFFCILVLHIYKNCCILSLVETRQDMKIQHFIKSAYESLPYNNKHSRICQVAENHFHNCLQRISREVFCHEYDKIPRHTGQNPITAGDLEWILTKYTVNEVNSIIFRRNIL